SANPIQYTSINKIFYSQSETRTTTLELKLFFFSSRRRHTRFSRDWSSDVCSSDLFRFPRSGPPPPSVGRLACPATQTGQSNNRKRAALRFSFCDLSTG